MKRTELVEIKNLNTKEIVKKILAAKKELSDLVLDKNMRKLKDVKLVAKKRKDLAQMSTIMRQKQLLEQFDAKLENNEETGRSKKA